MKQIAEEARADKQLLKTAPHHTPIKRLDDVKAVKAAIFSFEDLGKE